MINAKLAYLLSTCHKVSDAFFSAVIKQHEPQKIVATRHDFMLYIDLYEKEDSDLFHVRDVHFKFAGSGDPILAEVLQAHNNEILSQEIMASLYKNIKNLGINISAYKMVSMYSVASLIKLYRAEGFKYVLIPVVINYGRDSNLCHQSALLVDLSSVIMYYEPYGMYKKFDKSYKKCVCDLFSSLGNVGLFESDTSCITYHEKLNLDKGIQQIILEKNNNRAAEFNKEYDTLVSEFNKEFPNNFTIKGEKQDKTFKILELLFCIDTYDFDYDKKVKYEKFLTEALKIYCCYNSKTCVTITLVEMNEFFKGDIKNLYKAFNVEKPNILLMDKLNSLFLDVATEALEKTVKKISRSHEICYNVIR